MTEKLYYKDSMMFEFTANVLECKKVGDRFEIILDRTAFFPEGGGQSGDSGYIGNTRVFDTHEKAETVVHYADSEVRPGEVSCRIDSELRLSRMQCHSGEHIVSGLIHKLFGFENVGFHLGDNDVTIDINGILSEEDIRKVEKLANEAVVKDFEVKTYFPSKEDAEKIPYRSKLDIEENLRLVEYENYDICACCAPHVKRTGQIGIIKLLDYANYKGGVRIHMLCGMRALEDYQDRYSSVLKISNLLSAKQEEVSIAVEKLKQESEKGKHDASTLRRALADEMARNADETDKNLLFFSEFLDNASMRTLANSAIKKCGKICAVFSGFDGAYNFCIASRTVDLKVESKEIGTALNGRGGGSKEMICGSVSASRKEIEEYFK